ncbi:MAG TPA: peroxiredoxin [Spirochaetota bacterium]|nr:peroxiredoxin [Spirochaetota bacterium]HPI90622.1 peroxiredoxin [Spirochaetota bacterium]HPR46864.1 peroxiredoxin [Spirochaetota bacterium]
MEKLSPGQSAPSFTLPDGDGVPVSLSQFKGKWLVLYFYPRDNTSGCTIEAIDFTLSIADFRQLNAEIAGISPDSCSSHKKFAVTHELGHKLLSDPDRSVIQKYGVWQEKKLYGKKSMGVVRSTFLISPEGKIAHAWYGVKVKGHADQVLFKLRELASGK